MRLKKIVRMILPGDLCIRIFQRVVIIYAREQVIFHVSPLLEQMVLMQLRSAQNVARRVAKQVKCFKDVGDGFNVSQKIQYVTRVAVGMICS